MLPREEYEMTMVAASTSGDADNRLTIDPLHLVKHVTACYEQTIENINVIDSSDVHVGPRFISVTQNVDNTEVAKGRILGLELVSPQNTKRLRCSIAVFVCWTLVVTCVLLVFVFFFAFSKKPSRMDLDIQESWYLRRYQWYALPDRGMELLKLPAPLVIIGHSAMKFCTEKYECIQNMLEIQIAHQNGNRWEDIGPNFLVGGNGLVFEGRGANILGTMLKSFNSKCISIMFLGNYMNDQPTLAQLNNVKVLLKELVRKGVLAVDYRLYGHCQMIGGIEPPGQHIMDNLHHFDHWDPQNKSSCIRS